jgi:hypothetical protein
MTASCPTGSQRGERSLSNIRNLLSIEVLSLIHNFFAISEALWRPVGGRGRDSALPPHVRQLAIHPCSSSVRRLRLL